MSTILTVAATVDAPVATVWHFWNDPQHITRWNHASNDWHCPKSLNDLRVGGGFISTMAAKDGSASFDFTATYTEVKENELIEYTITDGRKVTVSFEANGNETIITENFEAENIHSHELQIAGWQSILNEFKKHTEKVSKMKLLQFEQHIHTPVEKVYQTMLEQESYKQWTSAFNAGSFYKGNWEKGSKILFVGINNEGKEEGMVSFIKEHIPNREVWIEHAGFIRDEKELMEGPDVEPWAGCLESYFFIPAGEQTIVKVTMESNMEYASYFESAWPKALEILKALCEQ